MVRGAHITKSLQCITDVVGCCESYEFDETDKNGNNRAVNLSSLPASIKQKILDGKQLSSVASWLNEFEEFAEKKKLTKKATYKLINSILKKYFKCDALYEPCTASGSMLEVKMYVIKKLFDLSAVPVAYNDLICNNYESKTVSDLVTEYKNKCKTLMLTALSFDIPVNILLFSLMSILLPKLPQNVQQEFYTKEIDWSKYNIQEFLNFVESNANDS